MTLITNRRKALTKGLGLTAGPLMSKPMAALGAAGKAETAVPPNVVTMPPG